MKLLVDCGNTRLKWAESDGGWRTGAALHRDTEFAPLLDEHWRPLPVPRRVLVSCVADAARRVAMADWTQRHWGVSAQFNEAQARQLDVTNLYQEPSRLGADRWAALLGARGMTKAPVCIVDCGTAVTVDALSAAGEFLGGVIFPGLALLRASLTHGTAGIRDSEGERADVMARTTADAVAAGTLLGLAGAIDGLVEAHRRALGDGMQVLLTGGDAPRLAAQLHTAHSYVPDLVLRGLERVAEAS
jgi:type III pantothenate kinase